MGSHWCSTVCSCATRASAYIMCSIYPRFSFVPRFVPVATPLAFSPAVGCAALLNLMDWLAFWCGRTRRRRASGTDVGSARLYGVCCPLWNECEQWPCGVREPDGTALVNKHQKTRGRATRSDEGEESKTHDERSHNFWAAAVTSSWRLRERISPAEWCGAGWVKRAVVLHPSVLNLLSSASLLMVRCIIMVARTADLGMHGYHVSLPAWLR